VSEATLWHLVLDRLREQLDADEFRRWFSETSQASDSGDQLSVWVSSAAAIRHISVHYQHLLDGALADLGRRSTEIRFIETGYGEDEDDE
jgi:chromosomal replication initiation ATPase DnaA